MEHGEKDAVERIIEDFMVMIEKINMTGKKPHRFNIDVDIFRSEIHIIKLIGDYSILHVSEIARKFGVTKGAVSQILKKLEKKGLIRKELDETNNTRLLVGLTEKGKKAYLGHEEHHRHHDRDMLDFVENLNEHELEIIQTFISKVITMAENHV